MVCGFLAKCQKKKTNNENTTLVGFVQTILFCEPNRVALFKLLQRNTEKHLRIVIPK